MASGQAVCCRNQNGVAEPRRLKRTIVNDYVLQDILFERTE